MLAVFKGYDASAGKEFKRFLAAGLTRWEQRRTVAEASPVRDAEPAPAVVRQAVNVEADIAERTTADDEAQTTAIQTTGFTN